MDDQQAGPGAAADGGPDDHRHAGIRRAPLQPRQRRRAALAAVAPVVLAAVVLTPFAILGPATAADVVAAALVYGGLLGLAAGFVYVDRAQARQCPRCTRTSPRGTARCPECGYDLDQRPRFACDERHELALEPGRCRCGRRLQPLAPARGIGREIAFILKLGAWLLAFLIGMGVLLRTIPT